MSEQIVVNASRDGQNAKTTNNAHEFPQLDLTEFDLLEIEKALYDLQPTEIERNPFTSYRLVDAYDNFGLCYAGIVLPEKHPVCNMISNDMLHTAAHNLNRCAMNNDNGTCRCHRVSFIGFSSADDEMIPECNLFPFHTEVKKNPKGLAKLESWIGYIQTADDNTDKNLQYYRYLNAAYETMLSSIKEKKHTCRITIHIENNVRESKNGIDPFHETIQFANIRRGIVLMCGCQESCRFHSNPFRNVKSLQWLKTVTDKKLKNGRLNRWGGQVSDSSSRAKHLDQVCKYARVNGSEYKALRIVMPHRILVIELLVRFGGLKRLIEELDRLSRCITDNPHDFELWWAMIDVLKNARNALAPEWSQRLTVEMERCMLQWVQTSALFLTDFVRHCVLQPHIVKQMLNWFLFLDDHDNNYLLKNDLCGNGPCHEFLGRHWALFATAVPYELLYTTGYADMSSRWIITSQYHPLYANQVRSLFESYVDLLPDLLNIVYSYCDVLESNCNSK